jgi:hypothetical protein
VKYYLAGRKERRERERKKRGRKEGKKKRRKEGRKEGDTHASTWMNFKPGHQKVHTSRTAKLITPMRMSVRMQLILEE